MGRRRREIFFAESSIVHVRRRPVDSNQKTYTRYFHYPKYDVIFGGEGGGQNLRFQYDVICGWPLISNLIGLLKLIFLCR